MPNYKDIYYSYLVIATCRRGRGRGVKERDCGLATGQTTVHTSELK